MKKKYENEDVDEKSNPKSKETKKSAPESKPMQEQEENNSGDCFSSEVEKQYQEKKGKFAKLTGAFSKSFIPPQAQTQSSSKWRDLQVRAIWSIIMLVLFTLILALGHFYCALLVLFIIICIYYELIDLQKYRERNNVVKHYYLISWYTFIVGVYYLYIRMIKEKIIYLNKYKVIHYLLHYHNFISFILYIIGFFLFIKSLTKGYYRYQFSQFAYIHIILLIFGVMSSLIIYNIFSGLVWFLIPVSLVIVNDISAYIWGRLFGKHQLTPLSPKKTWEGFIGAFFTTSLWCFIITEVMLEHDFLLCPVEEIGVRPFKMFSAQCDLSDLKEVIYTIESKTFGISIPLRAFHFHTFFMGIFASLYAPLGGLFASGFKRGIKIKDFADTIPGHGGLTDRMDCQLLMGFFTYVWLSQFYFYDEKKAFNELLNKIDQLETNDKLFLFNYLKNILSEGLNKTIDFSP